MLLLVCTALMVKMCPDNDCLTNYLHLLDRCISHQVDNFICFFSFFVSICTNRQLCRRSHRIAKLANQQIVHPRCVEDTIVDCWCIWQAFTAEQRKKMSSWRPQIQRVLQFQVQRQHRAASRYTDTLTIQQDHSREPQTHQPYNKTTHVSHRHISHTTRPPTWATDRWTIQQDHPREPQTHQLYNKTTHVSHRHQPYNKTTHVSHIDGKS